jgi:hypothetical protein
LILKKTLALKVVVPLFVPKLVPEWGEQWPENCAIGRNRTGNFGQELLFPNG